ncbi:unnamed protein product [Allacma fusca]|uniref:Uncharacterized protein n=1 Tax=Allacma fusca TaxID=39272 RepID=A0A8J2LDN6_9HEXA|nr:unnamed protein product [Allacma fusca]
MAPLFLQRRILRSEILLLVVILIITGCADSKPAYGFAVANSREDGTDYANAAVFDGKTTKGSTKFLYGETNHLDEELQSGAYTGILKQERLPFGVSETFSTGVECKVYS